MRLGSLWRGRGPLARKGNPCGFSVIELLVTLSVMAIVLAGSVPITQGVLKSYHLNAAATAVTGAIQSTRYQAISVGCAYTIAFTQSSTSYQIGAYSPTGSPPTCATTASNIGGTISWSGSGDVSLSPSTTLQLNPNGSVSATTGSLSFALSNGTQTSTITISGVGNVSVATQ